MANVSGPLSAHIFILVFSYGAKSLTWKQEAVQ